MLLCLDFVKMMTGKIGQSQRKVKIKLILIKLLNHTVYQLFVINFKW